MRTRLWVLTVIVLWWSCSGHPERGADTTVAAGCAPTAHVPVDGALTVSVECMRDMSDNADAGVPDSIWRVARAAGSWWWAPAHPFRAAVTTCHGSMRGTTGPGVSRTT